MPIVKEKFTDIWKKRIERMNIANKISFYEDIILIIEKENN